MTYHPYASCRRCSGGPLPGTVDLMKYVLERFPFTRSMGIYVCRHVGGTSTLSLHACGRALDVGIPTLSGGAANTDLGFQVVRFFDEYASDFGIMGQIYARLRYDLKSPRGRYYGGVHPHNDHDHAEQTTEAGNDLRYADYVRIAGPAQKGDPMLGLTIGPLGAPSVKALGVRALQQMLLARGEKLPQWGADGAAGDETRHALRAFQGKNAMSTGHAEYKGGVIGDDTYALLNMPGGGGGITQNQLTEAIRAAVGAHAGDPEAHPHGHDEGRTGGPIQV